LSDTMSTYSDRNFIDECIRLFTIGFIVFYYISLISFSETDRGYYSVTTNSGSIENWGGEIGAFLASMTLYFFGWASALIPLSFLFGYCVKIYRAAVLKFANFLAVVMSCGFLATLLQMVLSDVVTTISFDHGGYLGFLISMWLLETFGAVGQYVVILTLLSMSSFIASATSSLSSPLAVVCQFFAFGWGCCWKAAHQTYKIIARPFQLQWQRLVTQQPAASAHHGHSLAVDAPANNSAQNVRDVPVILPEIRPEKTWINPLKRKPFGQQIASKILRSNNYAPPCGDIFNRSSGSNDSAEHRQDLEERSKQIVGAFDDFGINGRVVGIQPGPVVTVYEFEPDAGTKLSKIMSLVDDIALALRVESVFILPARAKRAVAIQVPNTKRRIVYLGDIILSQMFESQKSALNIALGISLSGEPVSSDLATMPHLLMAGATGAGKSVAINALLCSILSQQSPDNVRLIMVDPKMLELSIYEGIPHLLMPVITDPIKASLALKWATCEMEKRYRLMQLARVRNIDGFNEYFEKLDEDARDELCAKVGCEEVSKLPYIVLVIDELADLMLTAPKDVETSIQRLAQKARASGIHLVLATQRPSVDILTGVIKANLPCRISFQTVSKHDSRTILDQIGSDKLLGKGDLLFMKPGVGRLERLQGALVDENEVIELVDWLKENFPSSYDESIMSWIDTEYARQSDGEFAALDDGENSGDPLFHRAIEIAASQGTISASFLQRQLKIGYNRAARIVEQMEMQGMVSPADGSKPREWLGGR
jgi:DNA segregation ATPase FtsK/SpoIIIE, S-DNA-T family